MRIFQVTFRLDGERFAENFSNEEASGSPDRRDIKNSLHEKTLIYNEVTENMFFFVASAEDNIVKCVAIEDGCREYQSVISDYIYHIRGVKESCAVKEITGRTAIRLLHCSEYFHYEWDEIIGRFNLDLNDGYGTFVEERLIKEIDKDKVYARARKILSNSDLLSELDRIYAGEKNEYQDGHPVHYMIRVNDSELSKTMQNSLLSALYAQNRICSLRCCEITVDGRHGINIEKTEKAYLSSKGGTVVLNFELDETDDSYNYAGNTDWIAERICGVVKKYRNKTLTIFCLPEENTRLKKSLTEHLGTVTTVELGEEFEYGERTREFLAQLAEENGRTADGALFSRIEENKGYKTAELIKFFDEWYSEKLKEEVYPQYKEFKAANECLKDAPVKGSAADELKEMIGLSEAKKVIWRALDYFKAQKVFKDLGMTEDRPSMHMAFTGSPGTAKTTVARLFARILRDNGVLETGAFLELGRSDLVGKYVGWTAPLIKRKFKEAKGGVLFIDEAYSLLDDRSGSFGDEAINTIVQEMENHREDIIVIFAGYSKDMEDFLSRNPGLSSRIAYRVPFDDYNVEELIGISDFIAEDKGLLLTEGAKDKMKLIYESAKAKENFGNGRYVRNVIEKAKMAQAQRLLNMDLSAVREQDVKTILASDIELPAKAAQSRKIGF